MAAVVGGTTFGVAKLTKLIAVKIFDASGSGTKYVFSFVFTSLSH